MKYIYNEKEVVNRMKEKWKDTALDLKHDSTYKIVAKGLIYLSNVINVLINMIHCSDLTKDQIITLIRRIKTPDNDTLVYNEKEALQIYNAINALPLKKLVCSVKKKNKKQTGGVLWILERNYPWLSLPIDILTIIFDLVSVVLEFAVASLAVGIVISIINLVISILRLDWLGSVLAVVGIIPWVGDPIKMIGTGGKILIKVTKGSYRAGKVALAVGEGATGAIKVAKATGKAEYIIGKNAMKATRAAAKAEQAAAKLAAKEAAKASGKGFWSRIFKKPTLVTAAAATTGVATDTSQLVSLGKQGIEQLKGDQEQDTQWYLDEASGQYYNAKGEWYKEPEATQTGGRKKKKHKRKKRKSIKH